MFNSNNTINTASATFFTFDHIRKTIVGSEINFKRAGNPSTPQYADLMKFMAMKPDYTLAPTPAKKKVEKKQTYAGLNNELIADFVKLFGTEDEKKVHAKMVADKTPYPTVKSWFLEDRKNFSVSKAKQEIAKATCENNKNKIRVAVGLKARDVKATKVIKTTPAVLPLPVAVNE